MMRALVFSMAIGTAGLAAWIALAMPTAEAPAPTVHQSKSQAPAQEVLVASADLGQGQTLTDTSMRWQPWSADAVNSAFITRADQPDAAETLKGSVVRSQFVSGEPIRQEKLAPTDSNLLSAILPAGKRAVAVRISAENTAGGFILPNDRVDVIHTVTGEGQAEGVAQGVSRTILTNVRVLAIDQKADDTNTEAVVVGKTATLQLDPEQAETVTGAEASGLLSLALRSTEDNDEAPTSQKQKSRGIVLMVRSGQAELIEIP